MAEINLSKYGITGTTEIVHNPSYDLLFEEETKPELEGYGSDNPAAKSQGIKQLMAGGGVVLIGLQLIPLLSGLFS